jgi:hypothetical protein
VTCLDTLLDRASDHGLKVTWGKRFQGRHWVEVHYPDGLTRTENGETRDEAARHMLIAILDDQAVTA